MVWAGAKVWDAPETVHSDSNLKDCFLHGAARAFFASAYADYVDDVTSDGSPLGEEFNQEVPNRTPPAAYALGGELWGGLAALNRDGAGVYSLARLAQAADGYDYGPDEWEDFGHYVAMEAMGHGVSWSDEHADFRMEVPRIECFGMTFDETAYKEE